MKKLLILFCAVFFLHTVHAQDQFCPGNIITNGDFELGTPNGSDENIQLAQGFSSIWQDGPGLSTGDFYAANWGPVQPMPQSGNYGGFWLWQNSTQVGVREGIMNQLTQTILPNTGVYTLCFDFACTFANGIGSPELGIYGVSNSSNGFGATPTGNYTPSNIDLFGAANTFHIQDIPINLGMCNSNKVAMVVTFDSASPGFPAGGLTHLFLTHSDNNIAARCYAGVDDLCLKGPPPSGCGAIVNEKIECVDGGYEYTFEVLNTSGLTVDGIDITIPGVGYDPLAWVPNGTTYGPVTVFIPDNVSSPYCFDVLMYSGIIECCHITHCIDLPLCFPCDDIALYPSQVDGEPDECCYEIDVSNNFSPNYFTGIVTTVITPGVNFDNPVAGANWTVTPTMGNVLTWTPPTPFMAQVSYLNPINFCFNNILQTSQMPQVVVFDWMTLDVNGQDSIACSDTLTFNCEPCLMIENKEIKCLDDGTFEYCFSVTNNGPDPATQLYLDPYGPSGTVFNPNPVPVNLAPGATDTYCVNISGVSSGDIVEYKALLKSFLNDTLNWCCIVDTFRVEIPECDDCVCDEDFFVNVAQGYSVNYGINSCQAVLLPLALDDCYEVRWTVNGATVGVTTGNEPFTYTIPSFTTYICMHVSIPGTVCSASFCRKLKCFSGGGGDDGGGDDGGDLDFKLAQKDQANTSITIKNLYPNPVSDLLNVKLEQSISSERVNIQIVNAMGEIVLMKNNQSMTSDEIQVNVGGLSEGIYFLRLEGENIESSFQKFVKLK